MGKTNKIFKVGLKSNANFLFELTDGDNLGGTTGGVCHVSVIHLTHKQYQNFKKIIIKLGYNIDKSIKEISNNRNCDYSCYLVK